MKKENNIDCSPFDSIEEFLGWVSTNHGTDVKQSCEAEIKTLLAKGKKVNPRHILNKLTRATSEVDISLGGLRARIR